MKATFKKNTLSEHELELKLKRTVRTIVIIIVSLILLFTFFAPAVGGFFGLISNYRKDTGNQQKVIIQSPIFINPPLASNKESISLQGYASPGNTVKLFANGPEVGTVVADATGTFMFENIPLIKGRNTLFAKAIGENNTESEKSQTLTIEYDTEKPDIEIETPDNDDTVKNLDKRVLIIGKVNEQATITINDKSVILKPDLTFDFLLGVEEGEVEIKIKAIDTAGNEETETLKITYQKKSS